MARESIIQEAGILEVGPVYEECIQHMAVGVLTMPAAVLRANHKNIVHLCKEIAEDESEEVNSISMLLAQELMSMGMIIAETRKRLLDHFEKFQHTNPLLSQILEAVNLMDDNATADIEGMEGFEA